MSIARRHHTVPQFYLRGFSRDDQIATVELPGDRTFLQSVRKAASEIDFYSLEGHPDGQDAFEKVLSSIEGDAAQVLAKIEGGTWPLSEADRVALAYFVCLQVSRGPDQRRNMDYVWAQAARMEIGYGGRDKVSDWIVKNGGPEVSPELADEIWADATKSEGPALRVRPVEHIRQIIRLSEELLPYVFGRPWTLVRFSSRALITSDCPVSLVPHQDEDPWMGVGFLTAWGITYPLTRRIGLLMSDPLPLVEAGVLLESIQAARFDRTEPGTTQMERFFNDLTARGASRWIFHHPEDGAYVPPGLQAPRLTTIAIAGDPLDFSDLQSSGFDKPAGAGGSATQTTD